MTPKKIAQSIGGAISEYFRTTDKWLWLLCVLISGTSVFFLTALYLPGDGTMARPMTQIIATLMGMGLAVGISLIDYHSLMKAWKFYAPIFILAVMLTFFVGVERGSNRAWLSVPILGREVSVQPAEFLKISFITTFAVHLHKAKDDMDKLSTVLLLCLHGAAHVGLIMIQNDTGTAVVFMGIFLIMIFLAGINWKYITVALAALVPAVPLFWYKFMSLDQKMRFLVLKDPTVSERYSFQQMQGLKALGVGGTTGIGFTAKHVFVPESYNDFIFTFIGETAGFIGCLAVIALLLLLCLRLVHNYRIATDTLGSMICAGVLGLIVIQMLMNIGMCLNILPVIGVTLPFLSAGGSSVLALYMGIGLVLSVHRHAASRFFSMR